jgi:hypothetical protein
MGGLFAVLYGVIAYAIHFGTILYPIGFVGNLWVQKSIDSGVAGSQASAVVIDVMLLTLFAMQHVRPLRERRIAAPLLAVAAACHARLGAEERAGNRGRQHDVLAWLGDPLPQLLISSNISSCSVSARCSRD